MEKMVLDKVRSFVNKKYYDDLVRGTNEDISKGLQNELKEVISQLREVYGVDFKQISVIDIGPSDERFAQATKDAEVSKKQGEGKVASAEFEAEAKIIASEAEARAFANETMGSALESVAVRTRKSKEELSNLLETNPEKFYELHGDIFNKAYEKANEGYAMRKGSFFNFKGSGGSTNGTYTETFAAVMAANEASRKSEGREVDRKENTKEKKTSR
jgi:hypothetical protein